MEKLVYTVLENISDAVIITDEQRKILVINNIAQDITGYGSTEVTGLFVGEILKIYEDENLLPIDAICPPTQIETRDTFFDRKNLQIETKSGERKVVKVKVERLNLTHDRTSGCIIIMHDTSKESELERSKVDFVSMSAHSLRTPITIIRGYLQTLLQDTTVVKLDGLELDAVNQSITAAENLKELVENLMIVSNLMKGEIKIRPLNVDIESIVKSVFDEYKHRALEKNLEYQYLPPVEKLPNAYGDIVKTKEVLTRLIDNAIKFTEKGKVEVSVKQDDGFIVVSVKDTGRGIPEKVMTRLFTKFFRIKSALEMESGSGLGLYFCKKIVEAQGGKIEVTSTKDVGSEFKFTIPIAKS